MKSENNYKNVCGNYTPGMSDVPPYQMPYPHEKMHEELPFYGSIKKLEEELFHAKCACTHVCKNRITAHPIGDGRFKCDICGEEFEILGKEKLTDVTMACEMLSNALQTIKVVKAAYANTTDEKLAEVLAVINQIPKQFKETIDITEESFKQSPYENNYIGPVVSCPKWMHPNEEE